MFENHKHPSYEVDDTSRIDDTRPQKAFQGCTFSGFKRTDVRSQFMKSVLKEDPSIEESCFWSAQLLASGHLMDIWEIILLVLSKHIHFGNPKLPLYVAMRFDQFREFLLGRSSKTSYIGREETIRNHTACRELIAELCGVLCVSRKKQPRKTVSIRDTDFDMFHLPKMLRAPTPTYIHLESEMFPKGVWTSLDPQEFMVASNELAYHVSRDGKDEQRAWYWMEWILGYIDRIQKTKHKGKAGKTDIQTCLCAPRKHCLGERDMPKEILGHPVWLIWDILMNEASRQQNKKCIKVLEALLELYGIKFTKGCVKKRKYLLYMGISLLCEPVAWDTPIVHESYKPLVSMAKKNIHLVYKQLKRDEIIEETDNYLFHNSLMPLSNTSKTSTPPKTSNVSTTNQTSTLSTHSTQPQPQHALPPQYDMPTTPWERQQIAEMIVERDDMRQFM